MSLALATSTPPPPPPPPPVPPSDRNTDFLRRRHLDAINAASNSQKVAQRQKAVQALELPKKIKTTTIDFSQFTKEQELYTELWQQAKAIPIPPVASNIEENIKHIDQEITSFQNQYRVLTDDSKSIDNKCSNMKTTMWNEWIDLIARKKQEIEDFSKTKERENFFNKSKELNDVKTQEKELSESIHNIDTELQKLRDKLKKNTSKASFLVRTCNIAVQSNISNKNRDNVEKENAAKELQAAQEALDKQKNSPELKQLTEEIAKLEDEIKKKKQEKNMLQSNIKKIESELTQAEKEAGNYLPQLNDLKKSLATLEQQLRGIKVIDTEQEDNNTTLIVGKNIVALRKDISNLRKRQKQYTQDLKQNKMSLDMKNAEKRSLEIQKTKQQILQTDIKEQRRYQIAKLVEQIFPGTDKDDLQKENAGLLKGYMSRKELKSDWTEKEELNLLEFIKYNLSMLTTKNSNPEQVVISDPTLIAENARLREECNKKMAEIIELRKKYDQKETKLAEERRKNSRNSTTSISASSSNPEQVVSSLQSNRAYIQALECEIQQLKFEIWQRLLSTEDSKDDNQFDNDSNQILSFEDFNTGNTTYYQIKEVLDKEGYINQKLVEKIINHTAAVYAEQIRQVQDDPAKVKEVIEEREKAESFILKPVIPDFAYNHDEELTFSKQDQADMFINIIEELPVEEREQVVEKLKKQVASDDISMKATISRVNIAINQRLMQVSTEERSVVGAGDGDDDKNRLNSVWTSGIFGVTKQESYQESSSYYGYVGGGVLGADFRVGNNTIIGAAYSNVIANLKYNGYRNADHVKANSHLVSLYGYQKFNERIFMQGMLSASIGKVVAQNQRFTRTSIGTLKNMDYNFETSISYNIDSSYGLIVTPNIGIKYNHHRDGAYTETGAGIFNISKEPRSASYFSTILGAKMMMQPIQIATQIKLTPEIYSSIEHCLTNKAQQVKAKLGWQNGYLVNKVNENKTPKTLYNIGVSLTAKHKNTELVIGYDCILQRKYQSHQGSVKLKISF